MSFAERYGFVATKTVQMKDIDAPLKNRLYNVIHKYLNNVTNDELVYVIDKLGHRTESTIIRNWSIIDTLLKRNSEEFPWYLPYEIIEYFLETRNTVCIDCDDKCYEDDDLCVFLDWKANFTQAVNAILEEEKSGYRLVEDKFINVINQDEVREISEATQTPYHSVNMHVKKALMLYADRKNPDYENSIKEAISAVEAMCNIITGMSGASATLGKALIKLEEKGVVIHKALRDAFTKLYGYTSDADGIRHGGIDFKNAPAEDAKYMLISCSAFVNYLIEKHSQNGGID